MAHGRRGHLVYTPQLLSTYSGVSCDPKDLTQFFSPNKDCRVHPQAPPALAAGHSLRGMLGPAGECLVHHLTPAAHPQEPSTECQQRQEDRPRGKGFPSHTPGRGGAGLEPAPPALCVMGAQAGLTPSWKTTSPAGRQA